LQYDIDGKKMEIVSIGLAVGNARKVEHKGGCNYG